MQVVRMGTLYEPGIQSLGEDLLKYTVQMATWPQFSSTNRAEAVAFVRGSGLDVAMELFGLPIDPEHFRWTFFRHAS